MCQNQTNLRIMIKMFFFYEKTIFCKYMYKNHLHELVNKSNYVSSEFYFMEVS